MLTGAHREYRRKNTTILLGQVEACLGVIRSTGGVKKRETPQRVVVGGGTSSAASATEAQPSGSGGGTSRQQHEADSYSSGSNAGDKRKRSSTEEQTYDTSARQHDTIQNPGGSTMLNSGLRTRYAELQRGRDVEERRLKKKEEEEKEQQSQANADADALMAMTVLLLVVVLLIMLLLLVQVQQVEQGPILQLLLYLHRPTLGQQLRLFPVHRQMLWP